RCEGEPGRDTRIGGSLARLSLVAARAEPGAHALLVDPQCLRRGLLLGEPARGLAKDVRQTALEAAHAGLPRVLADHEPERVVGELDAARVAPRSFQLLPHEVLARDPELLLLRVAGELAHIP